jgi:hypothetical protein
MSASSFLLSSACNRQFIRDALALLLPELASDETRDGIGASRST